MKNLKKYCFIALLLLCPFFKAVTIPFDFIDGKIIVKVKIRDDQHNFIFDSGAFTIISSELTGKLNEKKSSTVFEGIDANNVRSKMDVFSTNNLQISDLNFENINFSFADIGWMSSRACKKISGILGANMMRNRIWRIDFKSRTITMSDKAEEEYSAASVMIPFSEENFTGVPKINAKIRNQDIRFIFDTGSGMGFTMNQKSYDAIKDKNFLAFEGLLSQSLNSISKGERRVDIMEVEINNSNLGNQLVDSSSDSPDLIGTRFIENYLVDLDFINKRIVLNRPNKSLEYLSFGISFAPVNDNLIIVNKLQIPQLSGLNLTEKIIKINNMDTSKINNEIFCKVKLLLDNSQTITLENASHEKFTLEKKDILRYLN